MEEDLLREIGLLLQKFDRRYGSHTRATLTIEKELQGAPAPASYVQIEYVNGYVPHWGKRIHPIFQPPAPGQTRLAVNADRRLVFHKLGEAPKERKSDEVVCVEDD